VPSAKQFLALQENRNFEHPPLGKLIIAASIGICGDRPIGWRFMSTVFGALTAVGMFLLGLALFRNEKSALLVVILSLLNQLLYVQARVAMLDTFMMAFLVWGLAWFCFAWDSSLNRNQLIKYLCCAGIMFGLAMACKWTSFTAWFGCLFLMGVAFRSKHRGIKHIKQIRRYPTLWQELRFLDVFLCFIIIPVVVYYITFIPFFFIHRTPAYTLWDILFKMQWAMWDGQMRVVSDHPYMSNWITWPWMTRPIWYAYENSGTKNEFVRGVILLGNPIIMWGGVWAMLSCIWDVVEKRSREAFFIVAFYVIFFFSWAIIPRKIMFYYYYYPAGMILSLALVFLYHELKHINAKWTKYGLTVYLAIALGMFIYFFPVLSAYKISTHHFYSLMWFRNWI
ncbi:MAG: glycosyltransferase family 39 protein, partial [Deltaproteobacteria bacterium]|nr:glycosyltransferase family 39 protein [Deltaproteobacteria bacterium]